MTTFISVRSCLLVLVLSLFGYNVVCPKVDTATYPRNDPHEPTMDGPELPEDQVALLQETFYDAVLLARNTAMYWPACAENDERFLRYFRAQDVEFVRNMFRALANIPFDTDLSDEKVLQELLDEPPGLSAKFTRTSIYFLGDHPGQFLPDGPGEQLYVCGKEMTPGSGDVGPLAITISWAPKGETALISMCPFVYDVYPWFGYILDPPSWAIDDDKDQSEGPQYYDGYTCNGLQGFDSDYMSSPATTLLHELFHVPGLFDDVPGYSDTILTSEITQGTGPGSGIVQNLISDWKGDDPKYAYGAFNTRRLNELEPTDKEGLKWRGIYNADNYLFYALSSYYSRKCNLDFRKCPDEDAAYPGGRYPIWPFDSPQPTRPPPGTPPPPPRDSV